jgi:hypothetical protein
MLSFDASSFAIAGAIAAAGPIIIHLLNRRRFKTVSWAAMDFLREALERNRRVLHFRDILLLALRVLAVVLFGLVLARPFFKGSAAGALWHAVLLAFCLALTFGAGIAFATSSKSQGRTRLAATGVLLLGLIGSAFGAVGIARQSSANGEAAANARAPVHAVLIIDNSRSMGVEALGGTLLDRAKGKAVEFIDSLPPESRITVLPLAGAEDQSFTLNAYPNKEDARRQLERVKLVDTEGSVRYGLEQAQQACQQMPDLPTKRVVLITDLQANQWQSGVAPELLKQLTGMQVVDVTTTSAANVFVSKLHLEDGLASAEVPCRLLARIEASSATPTRDATPFEAQVRLLIDGTEVASQSVELSPGQSREVEFTHQFDVVADPLKPGSAVATVVVQSERQSSDQLPSDNYQQIVVPIVASLPVVFVDQYGDDENLEKNKIGETYALRHLMAPRSSSDKSQRRLIHIEHVRPEQVTQELLESARLVVIAGVERPDEGLVSILREFVQQGGPLVILAGAHFDSVAWQERAWLDGRGILPAPLDAKALGVTPEEAPQQVQAFFARFASMHHDFFLVDGEDPQSLASLFEATPFFKAAKVEVTGTSLEAMQKAELQRLTEEKSFLEQYASRQSARSTEQTASARDAEEDRKYRAIEPAWWNWRSPMPLVDRSLAPADLAKRGMPRVLATFDKNDMPFAIERSIGAGRVVMFTSGVSSNWNLLRGSGAMYMFHRTFCQLMEATLPVRNFHAGQKIAVPMERRNNQRLTVTRPSGQREPLNLEAIGSDVSGVLIRRPVVAGTYLIAAERADDSAPGSAAASIDEIPLAVNGAEAESILLTIPVADLQQKLGHEYVRVLTADEPIQVEGGTRRGQDLWKLFACCVLGSLLLEQLVLAWPMLGQKKLASSEIKN